MTTVTIPKKEYKELLDAKLHYEYLRQVMEGNVFAPPPTKDIKTIVKTLRETKRYNNQFLQSLKRGMRRSSYFGK
ncbi:MAG: hypothetical protein A2214_00140 [Candidatus Harrisonbacteria bacterium RIFOXYA1_FULL_48_8]|uniref:Uncharacterized protein n=1 Tax=Candidatus Harrisonbacteria bacterium RIFOXYA1_FULL_48_8 TaxID=1798411 RepID=A0A1G1ZXI9_9BACT|nr:MAG: hypothetical protein A2214_00140 [Candidatus Harrisonbacteria bacterium RIFOXYA1_FULL_48_8]